MSPATATPPKAGKLLATLEKHEARYASEKAKADRLSRDLMSKVNRLRELHDERRRLIARDPSLVDHHDAPLGKGNAVASVDEEIRGLGDLEELGQKAVHQKRIADRANEDTREFIETNLVALLEDLREPATAIAAKANAATAAAREAADDYVNFNGRVSGILAAAHRDTRVPGLDHAAAFSRQLRNWQLPVPLPEVHR